MAPITKLDQVTESIICGLRHDPDALVPRSGERGTVRRTWGGPGAPSGPVRRQSVYLRDLRSGPTSASAAAGISTVLR